MERDKERQRTRTRRKSFSRRGRKDGAAKSLSHKNTLCSEVRSSQQQEWFPWSSSLLLSS